MVLVTEVRGQAKIFNVMNYSAVADGATDNSQVNSYDIASLLVSLNFIESFFFFFVLLLYRTRGYNTFLMIIYVYYLNMRIFI